MAFKPRESVVCFDGFEFSVQAGENHYCTPRVDATHGVPFFGYTTVEVGFPSEQEPLLMPYVETPDGRWDTIYPYTPVDVIYEVITKHGGLASSRDTLPPMKGIVVHSDVRKEWPSVFPPEQEGDTFRLARITMAEQLHAALKKDIIDEKMLQDLHYEEEEKLLLFPGMKLPSAWLWKRDAQGLTRKATNWKAINYPSGMDFLAWQVIWGDAIL